MRVTCRAVPTQIEGTLSNGDAFYFRERNGYWTFTTGADMTEAVEKSLDAVEHECDEFMPVQVAQNLIHALAATL